MRLCKRGEILTSNTCEVCQFGKYSFEEMSLECKECPKNANCSNGHEISVNPGFWRSSVDSLEIYKCPKASACLGGFHPESEFPVECKLGFSSYLCQTCVFNEEYWYVWEGNLDCNRCPEWIGNIFKVIGMLMVFMLWIAILIFFNLRRKVTSVKDSQMSVLLRILTNYT